MDYHYNPWHTQGMAHYERKLKIAEILKRKSLFLLGPRGTGKTTFIRTQLPEAHVYDLLDNDTFSELVRRPKIIGEQVSPSKIIVIDEIQKYPPILDEVQRLIDKHGFRFFLTGSSARKLRRGAANLLGGRAWESHMFPLTSAEIPEFDLITYLNSSGLPYCYGSKVVKEEMRAYVNTYLREEIQAEAATRNLKAFAEFLDLAALSNGEEVNFETMASDCGVSPSTLKSYYQILEDTLVGFMLPGFTKTKKRKAISRSKHYFFDIGVVNYLTHRGVITEKSELFGRAFEQFILQEVRAYCGYARIDQPLTYWRSTSQFEVDLIVGNSLAIEIKSTSLVSDQHLKGMRALREEKLIKDYVIVSLDRTPRQTEDGISILPWKEFRSRLWRGELVIGL